MGRHEFAYALFPHVGGWREGGVVREGILFNAPLLSTYGGWDGSFATVEGGLVLDTIKRAEDSEAIVLRLYEPHGGRGVAQLRLAAPVASARRANLLEDPGEPVDLAALAFRPHEVITLIVS